MFLTLLLLASPSGPEPVMVRRLGGAIQVYTYRVENGKRWRYTFQLPGTASDDEVQDAARRLEVKPVEVPVPVFRSSVQFHAGHSCPGCGRSQFVVAGWNRDGTHTHVCPACGTGWRH